MAKVEWSPMDAAIALTQHQAGLQDRCTPGPKVVSRGGRAGLQMGKKIERQGQAELGP